MALTFLDNFKTPFAATKTGIAVNTVLGLPKATLGVAKDIGRGIARSIGSAGLTAAKPLGGSEQLAFNNLKSLFGQELFKNVFGDQPVKAIEDRVAKAEIGIKDNPFAKNLGLDKYALPLAFGGIMGSTALDLTPFGGLEKNAAKAVLRETTEAGALKIARSLGADEQVAKQIAPIFASTKTEKEAEKSFELFKSLLGTKQAVMKEAGETASKQLDPLTLEARKYKSAEDILYHGTTEARARQIADSGLISGSKAGNTQAKDVFLSNTEQYAKSYADRKGGTGGVILRTTRNPDIVGDINTGLKGDFKTAQSIPADNLQIKGKDGNWYNLKEYDFDNGKGLNPMGDLKQLEPLAERARQYKNVDDFINSFKKGSDNAFCIEI